MKLSIALTPHRNVFGPLLYAGDLARGMRRAAELGCHGVELNLRDTAVEDLDAIVALAEAHGLQIVSLGSGQAYLIDGLSVAAADPEIRRRLVQRLAGHVDFAARVGAQVVIGGVRGRFEDSAADRQAQYWGAVEVVHQVTDYASSRGVTITLEPINRYESNFLNTVDDTLGFLQDVDRPSVKILLDTYHMNIEEASMTAAIEQAGSRLSHVHLVDSNRRAPGMGHIDFPAILDALCSIGYDGYLSGEVLPLPDDDAAATGFTNYTRCLLNAGSSEISRPVRS
jgi:5-keto-L-gluconate epimerase